MKHFSLSQSACAALALAFAFLPVAAAAPKPIPSGGTALLPADAVSAFGTFDYANASVQRVDVTGQPFTKAIRMTTKTRPANTWDVQAQTKTVAPIKKGDVCLAVFTMRVTQSGGGYGRTNAIVEDAASYSKSLEFEVSAGGAWETFYAPFTATQDESAGQAQFNLHMGFAPQTVEVGGISVTDYGTSVKQADLPETVFSYDGRDANAPWRKAAAARIDTYRKGNVTVKVVDANGKAVRGAIVHVLQTRHAFDFGTAVDNVFISDRPNAAPYRALTYKLFNSAVIGNALKAGPWDTGGTDAYGDPYTRANALKFVSDLRAHGMKVRGHNLVWPSWQWSGLYEPLKNDPAALSAAILNHITDEVTALQGQCYEWDVVNEPYTNHDVQDILGPHCLVDWYTAAHAADPKARLFINDYSITENNGSDTAHIDAYDAQIKYLLDNNAPLGGIGLQSHFGRVLTPPDTVYAVLNRFARFGLPLKVTEFDVNVPDEQLQADYLRDYMTITFSHPAINGFIMWGFWQGDHWLPDAALYRTDFSVKPSGQMYQDLVFKQWWTDTQGKTASTGQYKTRAFLGDYTVSATLNGKTVSVPARVLKNQTATTTVLIKLVP